MYQSDVLHLKAENNTNNQRTGKISMAGKDAENCITIIKEHNTTNWLNFICYAILLVCNIL